MFALGRGNLLGRRFWKLIQIDSDGYKESQYNQIMDRAKIMNIFGTPDSILLSIDMSGIITYDLTMRRLAGRLQQV